MGILFLLGAGCASPYDSNVHPTRLKVVDQSKSYDPVDLDGDGRDEFVQRGEVPGGSEQSVVIQSLAGRPTAQVHFTGRVLPPQFVDATQNGSLEIVAPVVQGNSLFYNVVSADGRKLGRFFAVSGAVPSRRG